MSGAVVIPTSPIAVSSNLTMSHSLMFSESCARTALLTVGHANLRLCPPFAVAVVLRRACCPIVRATRRCGGLLQWGQLGSIWHGARGARNAPKGYR